MVNSASQYGIGESMAPLRGGRDLAYDTYVEQAKTRAAAQASVAFQALQTGLLSEMSNSMNAVHAQMDAVRQQQSEALAIQQELLNREQLQSYIEEFVFQAEKLVAECSKTTTDIPASSRYFLLMGVLGKIKEDGIGTSIIKGRDNKVAFEKVVNDTKGLTQQLLKNPEVQEALEWAEAERLRKAAEQKRLNAERLQAKQVRKANIKKLEQKLTSMQGQLQKVSVTVVLKDWRESIKGKLPEAYKTPLFVAICVGCVILWPSILVILFLAWGESGTREKELNKELNEQIATLVQELSELRTGGGE